MPRQNTEFQTIRSEGGLLPPDLLRRVVDPAGKLSGVEPTAYGLPAGERINEAITQSWNRLRRHWTEFRAALKGQPEGEAATGLTNDKWSLPLLRELGFGFLATTAGPIIDGKTYAISRFAGNTAIHLVGRGVSLDYRSVGVRGAAVGNPHGLVQEFLNRSPGHLWAILSNGLHFRILRDNQALSRQSFLEFDLEAMFDGEVYSDFVLLLLIAHATRFLPRNDGRPDSCWLETWSKEAAEQGVAALTDLRGGVEKALEILGQGFVSHPKNTSLREALRKGDVKLSDFHGQLLRIVYRLIFLFVAEDRELEGIPLLHPQDKADKARLARERYATHYSTSRLRELASRIKGSRHGDLWRQFQLLVGALSGDDRFATMRDALALPSLGSMLWNPAATALLNGPGLGDPGTELANVDFLDALRHLAYIRKDKILRPVDYKNLGSEEFGGVYESFLALTPQISSDGARFTFAEFAGNERKTSGSYYTPDSLVQCLLDSALDPVVQERLAGKTGKEAEKALLAIKVCDKAVGSGHFLVGAAHRLARHLARVRALVAGDSEPSPLLYQTALRDVIGHCLYGVDINPMSVELCKVTLWLEALEPGKPLSFLDHHIRCGNSLLGATPELIKGGIPDEAFEAIEGDDKEACSALKKKNKRENPKLGDWFIADEAALRDKLFQAAAAIDEIDDNKPEDIHRKETAFRDAQSNYDFQKAWDLGNLWCAAFVIKKRFPDGAKLHANLAPSTLNDQPLAMQGGLFGNAEELPKAKGKKAKTPSRADSENAIGITTQHLRNFVEGGALPDGLLAEAKRLADQYRFFHWHLAFPEVFEQGGFDVSLGNPPWERIKIQDTEFFAILYPQLSEATNAATKRELISHIPVEQPQLWNHYLAALRSADVVSNFIRNSGKYPLCGVGDVNTYAVFAELAKDLISPKGAAGLILPSGIATDNNTKLFFAFLTESNRLKSLYDFENRERTLFPSVYYRMRFCLFTLTGAALGKERADFVFLAHKVEDLKQDDKHFTLSAEDIALLNPDTKTCPMFLSARDAEITLAIFRSRSLLGSVYGKEAGKWDLTYKRVFDMSTDAEMFLESPLSLGPTGQIVKLYEGRMFDAYNHRVASMGVTAENVHRTGVKLETSNADLANPAYTVNPRFWVKTSDFLSRIPSNWPNQWFLALKDITSATNARTVIAAVIPFAAAGNTSPVLLIGNTAKLAGCFLANLNSFVLDFTSRKKVSGNHLTLFILEQLPFLKVDDYSVSASWASNTTIESWLISRVLELTYTAWDMEAFAQDCGWHGSPFRWDEERRFLLRCELDAAFFHLYLGSEARWRQQPETLTKAFPSPRDGISYIMDIFTIVRERDEEKFNGDYRTKRTILEIYDALAESMKSGKAYQTRLNPAPASITVAHLPRFECERVNFKEAGDYILPFVASLLRHQGGECNVMILIRAYAMLLGDRKTLTALTEARFGAGAGAWVKRFNQTVDASWFLPILRGLDNRDVIKLEERGENDVFVRLLDSSVPCNSTVETDVYLLLHVLDLNAVPPTAVAEQMKRISPKAIRTSLHEAKLVTA